MRQSEAWDKVANVAEDKDVLMTKTVIRGMV